MKPGNKDERFAKAFQDQRFRPIRQRLRKVQIDKRFQSMFTDKKFKVSYTHDKRGRPVKESSSENLKRYYQLSHEEKKRIKQERHERKQELSKKLAEEEQKSASEAEVFVEKKNEEEVHEDDVTVSSSDESEDSEEDLARGRGNESSSSDESEEEEFNRFHDPISMEHQWGELDRAAPRSEDVSKRLALCNMDWDRIKIKDVMVVMNSFKPAGGNIEKLSLYLSDFGKERITEENELGPAELREVVPTGSNAIPIGEALPDNKFEERFQTEKLRKYQINRLKYYFIVIECDSTATAQHLYNECDGREFETSCSKIDLRFIPDETSFEDRIPKEVLTSMPDLTTYEPSEFTTSALNQTKVELTWDETNYNRTKVTMRKFNKDDLENMDVRDFLASSSGSEDEDRTSILSKVEDVKKFSCEKDRISHFRNLLLGQDSGSENDVDMEVTWEPTSMQQKEPTVEEDDNEVEVEEDNNKQKCELELIMMEDDITKKEKHFNMDEIVENHKLKKKRKKKEEEDEEEDDFEIDVNDKRFSALYSSGKYNIDKSDPKYRKTDAMETLVNERQKRVKTSKPETQIRTAPAPTSGSDEISALIKSIKAKTVKKTKNLKN